MSRTHHPLIKAVAFFLLAAFCINDIAHAAPLETLSLPFAQNPQHIKLSPAFGKIQTWHKGKRGRLIVHIQDAHTNVSAQENVSKLLEELIQRYKLKTVFVEGGTRDDSLTYLRPMASSRPRGQVAKKYLMQGELNGAEYLNLTSDYAMSIQGVEEASLYEKNLKTYAGIFTHRAEALAYLGQIEARAEKLKRHFYPAELFEFDTFIRGFHSKENNFTEYHALLLDHASRQGINLQGFPNFLTLKGLKEKEDAIDFRAANEEQARLVATFYRDAEDRREIENLTEHLAKLKLQTYNPLGFYERLLEKARAQHTGPDEYANLAKYADYLKVFSSLEMEKLLAETSQLERMIYAGALKDTDAFYLYEISRHVDTLKGLFSLQVSKENFTEYLEKAVDVRFETLVYLAFLNRKLYDLGRYGDVLRFARIIDDNKKDVEEFYKTAEARDAVFLEKALRHMDANNLSIAALITGGYHTPNLKSLMEKNGVSYVVVAPNVLHETNLKRYEALLLGQLGDASPLVKNQTVSAGGDRSIILKAVAERGVVRFVEQDLRDMRLTELDLAASRLSVPLGGLVDLLTEKANDVIAGNFDEPDGQIQIFYESRAGQPVVTVHYDDRVLRRGSNFDEVVSFIAAAEHGRAERILYEAVVINNSIFVRKSNDEGTAALRMPKDDPRHPKGGARADIPQLSPQPIATGRDAVRETAEALSGKGAQLAKERGEPALDTRAGARLAVTEVGIVGLGTHGQRLLQALLAVMKDQAQAIKINAVARSSFHAVRRAVGQHAGLNLIYGDADRVLMDAGSQAVIIATRAGEHFVMARRALIHGKHVFVEKPFTLTAKEGEELTRIAAERSLTLMAGHTLLYAPHFERLKAIVDSGKLGDILSIEAKFLNPARPELDLSSNVVEDLAYHDIYMVNHLLVRGPTDILSAERSASGETAHIQLSYAGVPVSIEVSREHDGPAIRTVTVKGEAFTAVFNHLDPANLEIRPTQSAHDAAALEDLRRLATVEGAVERPLLPELRAFLNAVNTRTPPLSDGESALVTVSSVEAINKLLQGARLVKQHAEPGTRLAARSAVPTAHLLRQFSFNEISAIYEDVHQSGPLMTTASQKEDKTIVMVADFLAEMATAVFLHRHFPEDAMIGEEEIDVEKVRQLLTLDASLAEKYEDLLRQYQEIPPWVRERTQYREGLEAFWTIDPVDGTVNFKNDRMNRYAYLLSRHVWDAKIGRYVLDYSITHSPQFDIQVRGDVLYGPMIEAYRTEGRLEASVWSRRIGQLTLYKKNTSAAPPSGDGKMLFLDQSLAIPDPFMDKALSMGAFSPDEVIYGFSLGHTLLTQFLTGSPETVSIPAKIWDSAALAEVLGVVRVDDGRRFDGFTPDDVRAGFEKKWWSVVSVVGPRQTGRVRQVMGALRPGARFADRSRFWMEGGHRENNILNEAIKRLQRLAEDSDQPAENEKRMREADLIIGYINRLDWLIEIRNNLQSVAETDGLSTNLRRMIEILNRKIQVTSPELGAEQGLSEKLKQFHDLANLALHLSSKFESTVLATMFGVSAVLAFISYKFAEYRFQAAPSAMRIQFATFIAVITFAAAASGLGIFASTNALRQAFANLLKLDAPSVLKAQKTLKFYSRFHPVQRVRAIARDGIAIGDEILELLALLPDEDPAEAPKVSERRSVWFWGIFSAAVLAAFGGMYFIAKTMDTVTKNRIEEMRRRGYLAVDLTRQGKLSSDRHEWILKEMIIFMRNARFKGDEKIKLIFSDALRNKTLNIILRTTDNRFKEIVVTVPEDRSVTLNMGEMSTTSEKAAPSSPVIRIKDAQNQPLPEGAAAYELQIFIPQPPGARLVKQHAEPGARLTESTNTGQRHAILLRNLLIGEPKIGRISVNGVDSDVARVKEVASEIQWPAAGEVDYSSRLRPLLQSLGLDSQQVYRVSTDQNNGALAIDIRTQGAVTYLEDQTKKVRDVLKGAGIQWTDDVYVVEPENFHVFAANESGRRIAVLQSQKPFVNRVLATGKTMVRLLNLLATDSQVRWSNARIYHLDEYEAAKTHPLYSFRHYLTTHFVDRLRADNRVEPANIHFFADEISAGDQNQAQMDAYVANLQAQGGPDLAFMGLGPDGHLAFIRPGTPLDRGIHRVALSRETLDANRDDFPQIAAHPYAWTLGPANILQGDFLRVWMVNGAHKAAILEKALLGPVTPDVPASGLRALGAGQVLLVIDKNAAAGILRHATSDVEGSRLTEAEGEAVRLLVQAGEVKSPFLEAIQDAVERIEGGEAAKAAENIQSLLGEQSINSHPAVAKLLRQALALLLGARLVTGHAKDNEAAKHFNAIIEDAQFTKEIFGEPSLPVRGGKVLSKREAGVLRLRFGLNDEGAPGQEIKSLDDTGVVFKVTRERIRQIEAKALRRVFRYHYRYEWAKQASGMSVIREFLSELAGQALYTQLAQAPWRLDFMNYPRYFSVFIEGPRSENATNLLLINEIIGAVENNFHTIKSVHSAYRRIDKSKHNFIYQLSFEWIPPAGSRLAGARSVIVKNWLLRTGMTLAVVMVTGGCALFPGMQSPPSLAQIEQEQRDSMEQAAQRGDWAYLQSQGRKAAPYLFNLLKSGQRDEVTRGDLRLRAAAAHALDQIGWTPSNTGESVWYLYAKGNSEGLVYLGRQAVPYLVDILKEHGGNTDDSLFRAVGELKDPTAIPALAIFLRNGDIGEKAARTLRQLGWTPATGDTVAQGRPDAASAAQNEKIQEVVERKKLVYDWDSQNQKYVIKWNELESIGKPIIPHLILFLREYYQNVNGPYKFSFLPIVDLLERVGPPEDPAVLTVITREDEQSVRDYARNTLIKWGASAFPALRQAFEDPLRQEFAAEVLAQIYQTQADLIPVLSASLQGSNAVSRVAAIEKAIEMGAEARDLSLLVRKAVDATPPLSEHADIILQAIHPDPSIEAGALVQVLRDAPSTPNETLLKAVSKNLRRMKGTIKDPELEGIVDDLVALAYVHASEKLRSTAKEVIGELAPQPINDEAGIRKAFEKISDFSRWREESRHDDFDPIRKIIPNSRQYLKALITGYDAQYGPKLFEHAISR